MKHARSLLLTVAAVLPSSAGAHDVAGKVRVTGRADASVKTIVYAERLDAPDKPRATRARLTQKDKSFVPRVVAVPAGSTVDFPNVDPIFHNVFSLSAPTPFDLGLYRAGASKSRTFAQPATYRVFCNIHPEMTAVLLVLPTDNITETDGSGAWKLALPPGRYRITAWSERSQPATVELTVSGTTSAPELALDESKFVELPHKNKLGQDYPKNPYDPARDRKPN
jgi:plastocyanin